MVGALKKKTPRPDAARIDGHTNETNYEKLTKKYSKVPLECSDPVATCEEIVGDLFLRVPRWRSPQLLYNVGAAVNTAASAAYSIALDENVYNINDGLAGNMLVAEQAVAAFLSELGGIEKKCMGLFTFGGTATNLYATKLGLKKASPNSSRKGVPENLKVMITEDAHFSHAVAADWLGIGTDNIATMPAGYDRRTISEDAEIQMRGIFEDGKFNALPISSIMGFSIFCTLTTLTLKSKFLPAITLWK